MLYAHGLGMGEFEEFIGERRILKSNYTLPRPRVS